MDKMFCIKCEKYVDIKINEEELESCYNGFFVKDNGKYLTCSECGYNLIIKGI